jgi:hypothetical protein
MARLSESVPQDVNQRPRVLGTKLSTCPWPTNVYPAITSENGSIAPNAILVLVLTTKNAPPGSLLSPLALPGPLTFTIMNFYTRFSGDNSLLGMPCWQPLMRLLAILSRLRFGLFTAFAVGLGRRYLEEAIFGNPPSVIPLPRPPFCMPGL